MTAIGTTSIRNAVKGSSLVLLTGLLAACNPSSPTSPLQNLPSGRADIVISGIQIMGPQTLAPAESAQFRLIATMSDGMARDLTNDASWSTITEGLVAVSPQGLVTGRQTGDGAIAASIEGHRPVREVIVVPRGTYRLDGTVMEPGHSALPAALVEIIPRTGPGQSTYTNSAGAYKVHGVSGEIELRVTMEGYTTYSKRLDVAFHQSHSVELHPK
jgi:hypothetical protein